jgi:hypothetical protein
MLASDVVRILVEVEERFPVSTWTADGVRIWPLVRIDLATRLSKGAQSLPNNRRRLKLWVASVRRVLQLHAAYLRDRAANQSSSSTYPVVFLASMNNRRARIRRRWYNIFADPLVDAYRKLGVPSLLLERTRGPYRLPRANPSRFLELERRAYRRTRSRADAANPVLALPEFNSVARYLESAYGTTIMTEAELRLRTARLFEDAGFFESILRRVGARAGMAVCYYNNDGLAFNLACSRAGVTSVDIQHGVQGMHHFAYGRWANVPPSGYELIPDRFWCWSDREVAAIAAWTSGTTHHRAILGGNPFLDVWRTSDDGEVGRAGATQSDRSTTNILYTCNRESLLPPIIFDTIASSPPTWTWWVRAHPGMSRQDRRSVGKQLRRLRPRRIEFERATETPLFSLLKYIDVHVTRASTVVIDAAELGVPSVITHANGMSPYKSEIDRGLATFANEPKKILNAIQSFCDHRVDAELTTAGASLTTEQRDSILQALIA